MADSPLSLSDLLDEIEQELGQQEDSEASSVLVDSALVDPKCLLAKPTLPSAPAASEDSALNGLLERLEEMHQRSNVEDPCGWSSLPFCGAAKDGDPMKAMLSDMSALPILRPWAVPDETRVAAIVGLAEDANKGFRQYMEDGSKFLDPFLIPGQANDERWGFFAVYDGHGGREATDYCETRLHEEVLLEMRNGGMGKGKDAGQVLQKAFQKIDSSLALYGAWNHGSTATVALVHRKRGGEMTLHIANVGDSRAVLISNSGIRRVSRDHIPADAAEAHRIVQDGGKVYSGRVGGDLAISRSLGDHRLKGKGLSCMPDICTCAVASGHVLIIATDGLWDVLSDSDACDVLETSVQRAVELGGSQDDLMDWLRSNIAQELVDRAKNLGSQDNILVLVVLF